MQDRKRKTAKITCPRGHVLPNPGRFGECTPVHCATSHAAGSISDNIRVQQLAKRKLIKQMKGDANSFLNTLTKDMVPAERDVAIKAASEAATALAHMTGRRAARQALYKIPEGLAGGEAEEWAQKRAVELLPYAMAEMEHQLLYGDDTQRRDAARDVLDINGMRKREAGSGGGGATIILNLGGKELPWAQKVVERVTGGETNAKTSLPTSDTQVDAD